MKIQCLEEKGETLQYAYFMPYCVWNNIEKIHVTDIWEYHLCIRGGDSTGKMMIYLELKNILAQSSVSKSQKEKILH